MSSMWCILGWSLACSPRQDLVSSRDLPSLFPDANRALGPFSIRLEKSRETNVLSEARVLIEQGAFRKHVTLQLKMIHSQEQVTLSFLHQNPPSVRAQGDQGFETLSQGKGIPERKVDRNPVQSVQDDDARCPPTSVEAREALMERPKAPAFPDASALFHIPLPISVKDARDFSVTGAGEHWAIMDGNLVWDQKLQKAEAIEMSWTRDHVPETRYPLAVAEQPLDLKALRIDGEKETAIPVIWRSGYVWISAKDVREGSWLELHYDVPGQEKGFDLPQLPIPEGMKALVMIPGCLRENFIIEKSHLSWTCEPRHGALWAASYSFHQNSSAMDLADWPELARLDPASVNAWWDAGEALHIETYGSSRLLRSIPDEARRVCMRATWDSQLAH